MGNFVQWAPAILQASGTMQEKRDAKMQAQLMREQARAEALAAAQDEAAQRREARMALGRQAAAAAEAGVGVTGSAGRLLDQSAVLAELDALNIRYAGRNRARGLLAESMATSQRANRLGLLAGAQLLAGASKAFTSNRIAGG